MDSFQHLFKITAYSSLQNISQGWNISLRVGLSEKPKAEK